MNDQISEAFQYAARTDEDMFETPDGIFAKKYIAPGVYTVEPVYMFSAIEMLERAIAKEKAE